jgi:O-acetyl-ADP-ribose deacetylase (regulator of RNase III)
MNIVKGDLIKMAKNGEFDVIAHGCNCFNTMGGGIAKTIKAEFPEAYQVDCDTRKGDYRKLGTISYVSGLQSLQGTAAYKLTVVNSYTQFKHWKDKDDDPMEPLIDYDALRKAFKEIKKQFGGQNLKFGIPQIGAGLALGDWNVIAKIIDEEMEGENVTLVLFE